MHDAHDDEGIWESDVQHHYFTIPHSYDIRFLNQTLYGLVLRVLFHLCHLLGMVFYRSAT